MKKVSWGERGRSCTEFGLLVDQSDYTVLVTYNQLNKHLFLKCKDETKNVKQNPIKQKGDLESKNLFPIYTILLGVNNVKIIVKGVD